MWAPVSPLAIAVGGGSCRASLLLGGILDFFAGILDFFADLLYRIVDLLAGTLVACVTAGFSAPRSANAGKKTKRRRTAPAVLTARRLSPIR
jgi:hypothetical protein